MPFIDNEKRVLFAKDGEPYYYKTICSVETLRENPQVIEALNRLAIESEEDLSLSLQAKGQRLKNPLTYENSWKVDEKWLDTFEETSKSIALVEDTNGKLIALTAFMVNDEATRVNLGIDEDYIIFIKALTDKAYRNTGVITSLLGEVMKEVKDHLCVGCVSIKTAINEEGEEFDYVMNLPRYAQMFKKTFENNKLQVRCESPMGTQRGEEKIELDSIIESGSINQQTLSTIITSQRAQALAGDKKLVGFYIHGK